MLQLLLSSTLLLSVATMPRGEGHIDKHAVKPTCGAPSPTCQTCKTRCDTCQSAGCPVCGATACTWDCSADPGIDVDSLTVDAQSRRLLDAAQAELRFKVPDDTVIWLGNRRVSSLGEKRTVRVPIPDATKSYRYEARLEFVLNGHKYFRKIDIGGLQAGKIIAYTFTIPELSPDDIPTIDFVRQEVAEAKP